MFQAGSRLGKHASNYLMLTENEAVAVALQNPNTITFNNTKTAPFVEGTQYILLNCRGRLTIDQQCKTSM